VYRLLWPHEFVINLGNSYSVMHRTPESIGVLVHIVSDVLEVLDVFILFLRVVYLCSCSLSARFA